MTKVNAPILTVKTGLATIGASANPTYAAAQAIPAVAERRLWIPPVSTVRWRLRLSNYSSYAETGSLGAGTASLTGAFVGFDPIFTGGRYLGANSAAQTQFDGGGVNMNLGGLGDCYIGPWVTSPSLQAVRGKPMTFSVGYVPNVSNSRMGYTGSPASGFWVSGGGSSNYAGNATITGLMTNTLCMLDWRIEYEYETAAEPFYIPNVVVIGDSITAGYINNTSPYHGHAMAHETWPGAAALRKRFSVMNGGVLASTAVTAGSAGPWDPTLSGVAALWRWQRLGIGVTTYANAPVIQYDKAIVALGSNDAAAATAAATVEPSLQNIYNYLRATGAIPEVWGATVLPRNFIASNEAIRTAINQWLIGYGGAGLPGLDGIHDFDDALALSPALIETTATLVSGAGGNPITVASAAGIAAGQAVTTLPGSTGAIPPGTTVTGVSGTSITLSQNPGTAGAATLAFLAPNSLAKPNQLWDYPHPEYAGYQAMARVVDFH